MSLGTKFSDHFWDEQVSGYMILYGNLRQSRQTAKELETFLRDAASLEDQYQKQLAKICQSMDKFSTESSAAPLWLAVLKEITRLNGASHTQFVAKVAELVKQVQSYGNELRLQKNQFKQSELDTVQLIEHFRSAKTQLQRAKDNYVQTAAELDKQRKLIEQTQPASASSIHLLAQKLDKKLASQTGVYQSCIEDYNSMRDQLELKFNLSCDQFEQMERAHLDKMKNFLSHYLLLVDSLNSARSKTVADCHHKLAMHTTDHLLEQFLLNRSIEGSRPARAHFVTFDPELHEKSKSANLWDKLRLKSVIKTRTSSANAIELSKSSFLQSSLSEPATSSFAKAASLDSLDFHVSTKKNEGDMVNYYESDEDLQAKAWMKPSDSSDGGDDDDESDDSDMPKKIYLKINPVNEQRTTSPDQLNQIGKNLQLKITQPAKKVHRKSYKVDENNNLAESPQSDQPPPLPPLPPNLQQLMNQRVNELNRTFNESPCTLSKSFTDNEEEMQF